MNRKEVEYYEQKEQEYWEARLLKGDIDDFRTQN